MSFIEDTQTVEFAKYDDGSQGDGLLRIQWRNGEARSKTGFGGIWVEKRKASRGKSEHWRVEMDGAAK